MPSLFVTRSIVDKHADNSDVSWRLDTLEDYDHVTELFAELNLAKTLVPYHVLVDHDRRHHMLESYKPMRRAS